MIYIGTDIVDISRIDQYISDKGQKFLNHVFTESEQIFCDSKVAPFIHYGGKFAAKEAVKKAILSSKTKQYIPLNAIEILNEIDGAPIVILKDKAIDAVNLQVSISHTDEYATATAILELE